MKKAIIYLILFSCVFTACKNKGSNPEKEKKEKEEKNISKRVLSITRANSYSDLFLDSLAMEKFIINKKVADSLARRMRSFYNTRNYQFAWFASDGLTEQAREFWNLHEYYTTYLSDSSLLHDKKLQNKMGNLVAEEDLSVSASNKTMINTELTLTLHFLEYNLKNYEKGYVKRKEMERFIPRKKEDPIYLADSLLNKKHKDDKYFEDVNETYKLLKNQLEKYTAIAKKGGWPTIPVEVVKVKKGTSSPSIVLLKKRLQVTGDLQVADTSATFTDTLYNAIKNIEQRYGYTPDGKLSESLIKELNIPAIERVKQLLINMNRMRWTPPKPAGNLIIVNIPEFVLHTYEGKNKVFDMDVVVGKEGHNTVMFTGDLNQIVFSPYWNIPTSIVKKEILPAIEKDPGYLASQNMEIVNDNGNVPEIRQLPGPTNSLGKVKFLFPNSFNIYFHDTNAKSLFDRDKRAFSHGCIRLSEPVKMANYLLRDNAEWTPEKINDAMNSGVEKYVKLKSPVPVFVSYYTAWVDEQGRLNFREDIYDHDKKMSKKMFSH